MTTFYEREIKELKEKYEKVSLENKKNCSWAILLSNSNERMEEEKKLLKEQIDEFIKNTSDSQERNLKQIKEIEELTEKLHKTEIELNTERNFQEKKNKEIEELAQKLHEAEKSLIDERKVLEEKDKIIEA
ncbi:beta-mannosyltransferase 2-like [Cynara cardunculus var. scolymus]|uniref:beta-mannosyltransferase 2-like n=1 Tax=Cynara cardunculus var. scolymus TaxID=59895 RepID=UPI000D62F3C0|nr:beta-mannosyltransferase 2-like [Cynara cardunculus var. scolymus]